MFSVPVPRVRGLVSALLRLATAPVSLALGGLLLAAPALAQETPVPRATIMEVSVEEGTLTASILWPETAALPATATVVSYTGQGEPAARVEVTPKPNTKTVVKLPGALKSPWETGWSEKLAVEDDTGQTLASQPYDVTLNCDGNGDKERCELGVNASAATNAGVIHISEDLDAAIQQLSPRNGEEFDLVARVSEAYPELRGEALVYGDQVARARRPGPCECSWAAVFQRNPSWVQSMYNTGFLTQMYGDNGVGARHWLFANAQGQFLSPVHEISASVSGTSQVTLKLNCSQLLYIIDEWVYMFGPNGIPQIIHIYHPVYGACTAPCQATFNHMGRYTGQTYVQALQQPSNRAIATEAGTYMVNATTLINQATAAGGGFDNISGMGVVGYSSTGKVQTNGYARAVGRWLSAQAGVWNGFAQAIYGNAACVFPNKAAVWDFGTTQGAAHENSLKGSIQSFFWQYGIPVNP